MPCYYDLIYGDWWSQNHALPNVHEKASEPNGLTVEILMHHWETIGGDRMNHVMLTLIPKKLEPSTLEH